MRLHNRHFRNSALVVVEQLSVDANQRYEGEFSVEALELFVEGAEVCVHEGCTRRKRSGAKAELQQGGFPPIEC